MRVESRSVFIDLFYNDISAEIEPTKDFNNTVTITGPIVQGILTKRERSIRL